MTEQPENQNVHQHEATDEPKEEAVAPRRPLRSLGWALGEIGVVTVGILLAFALEAWWQDRSMAQQEQVHLHALASDFERNVEELERLIELEERIASSSRKLLLRAHDPEPEATDSVDELMRQVFNSSRYEPVIGAYEGLVNSSGLTLIRDNALRASLARFVAQVNDRYAESWSNELYFAFTREFGDRFLLAEFALEMDEMETAAEHEREFEKLLDNPEFRGHLVLRYYSEREMARKYKDLLQQAEGVLEQVRAQLRE